MDCLLPFFVPWPVAEVKGLFLFLCLMCLVTHYFYYYIFLYFHCNLMII
nr:MAG TPA: hypothetical protein [Caudoviricetes sp.]